MNNKLTIRSLAILAILSVAQFTAKAQTLLFANDFDSSGTGPALPADWTTNTTDSTWILTNARASNDTLSLSSKNYSLDIECVSAHANKNAVLTLNGFSTKGYKNISLMWAERYAPKYLSGGNTIAIQYSTDGGTTWGNIVDPGNALGEFEWVNQGKPTVLPAAADDNANVKLRWTAFIKTTNGNYQFDDLKVTGTSVSGVETEIATLQNVKTWYAQNTLHTVFQNQVAPHAVLNIYDSRGKLVQSGLCTSASNVVNVSSLTPGLYIANVVSEGMVYSEKFVKE